MPPKLRRRRDDRLDRFLGVPEPAAAAGLWGAQVLIATLPIAYAMRGALTPTLFVLLLAALGFLLAVIAVINCFVLILTCNISGEEVPGLAKGFCIVLLIGAGSMAVRSSLSLVIPPVPAAVLGMILHLVIAGVVLTRTLGMTCLSLVFFWLVQFGLYLGLGFALYSLIQKLGGSG